jgi:hemerythrin-like domain-containing protein
MACVHNILIRGLNAICLQSHGVKAAADITDFLSFVHAWAYTVHEHHDNEEKNTFPMLEGQTGEKGVMERNIVQHHAFTPGFQEMENYVASVTKKQEYNADKLQGLFDSFAPLLVEHLRDEITTLLELERFGDKIDWKTFTKELDKKTLANPNLVCSLMPLCFEVITKPLIEFRGVLRDN